MLKMLNGYTFTTKTLPATNPNIFEIPSIFSEIPSAAMATQRPTMEFTKKA